MEPVVALGRTADLSNIRHRLLRHGLRDFLVLSEPLSGNRGTSVTNGIQGYVEAAIAHYCLRPTGRLVVIEHYEREAPADDTFDQVVVRFDGGAVEVVDWKPLTAEMAVLLERAGQPLSRHIGKRVVISCLGGEEEGVVLRYDGRRYQIKGIANPVFGTVIKTLR